MSKITFSISCPVIAIDGPAASGKGTLSRRLADHLRFAHMDTGALYRAVGLYALRDALSPDLQRDAITACQRFVRTFTPQALSDPALRHDETGQAASKVASVGQVRAMLLDLQRDFARVPPAGYKGAVLDGRDIGTVICPDADAKLFITASDIIRAERRTKELQLSGQDVTYDRVLQDMRERDARDAKRTDAPMRPADDGLVLDTGGLTIDQAFDRALSYIQAKLT